MPVPTPTRRHQIYEAIMARLEEIRVDNGFFTDLGQHLWFGTLDAFGPDDSKLACCVMFDAVVRIGERALPKHAAILPVSIYVIATADTASGLRQAARSVLNAEGDVQRAMELEDRTLGGLVEGEIDLATIAPVERSGGSLIVGTQLTYNVPYWTAWGHP